MTDDSLHRLQERVKELTALHQTARILQRADQSPHTVTGSVTLVSDYRFRGISQTYEGPAVQGGFDYAHASGFYLGNWNSNVASQVYTGGSGIEMDVYGGYKRSFGGFSFDIGYLHYHYRNAEFQSAGHGSQGFDTQEIYFGGRGSGSRSSTSSPSATTSALDRPRSVEATGQTSTTARCCRIAAVPRTATTSI